MKHLVNRYDFGSYKVNGTFGFLISIHLGKTEAAVGIINTSLLIDSTQTLDSAHIESVLIEKIARIIGFDMSFISSFLSLLSTSQ